LQRCKLDVNVCEMEAFAPNYASTKSTILLVSDGKLLSDITRNILDTINNRIGFIIVDEGWLYKNPKAQKHQALRLYTEEHPTVVLSGSIMTARDITDIYGQVAIAGRAKALAPTLTKFRSKFQNGIQGSFFTWQPKPKAYEQIMELIEPFTYVYMPEFGRISVKARIISVRPTQEQTDLFKELKETAAIEGAFELNNMANIITKAQQISNGWLKGDSGIRWFESTKLDRLSILVDELMQTDYKQVIWCAFREDIARINSALITHGYAKPENIATLQSGQPFDLDRWNKKKCRICLATEASGSSVNHFAQVPYAIYFSQDSKFHSYQQSEGRHTRRSSEHDTVYTIFLHTEKSLDSRVHYVVKQSARSEQAFIRRMDVAQWLKDSDQLL
jgi:hypothetical protein